MDYMQIAASTWLDRDCVWIYLFRLHLKARANSFKFTVQQVGSHCKRHIVAIYSGCALILSPSGFKAQDEMLVEVGIQSMPRN